MYQVSSISRNVINSLFLLLQHLFENGTACHNSAFPVQGQVWGTLPPMLGRAACRAPCVLDTFFSRPPKNRPPVQIALVQLLEDASSSSGKRSIFFPRLAFVFPFFFHLNFKCWYFLLKYFYVFMYQVSLWNCARLAAILGFPVQGQV